jgi:homoserine/homoserine lactone efflux protein
MDFMMNWELFLAFCLASAALIAMPGPVVSLVIANSLRLGTGAGLVTVAAASTGNAVLIIAGAIGVTTMLALLSGLFDVVRLLGAAYLIYLGVKEWRSRGATLGDAAQRSPRGARIMVLNAFLIALTNPKAILFYIAFFPQFIDPTLPAGPQLAAMCAAFIVIAVVLDSCYAILAGRIRPYLMDARRALIRARITGSLLIATGIGLALARKE